MYSLHTPENYSVVVPDEFAAFGVGPRAVTFVSVEPGSSFYSHKVYMDRETMLQVFDLIINKVRTGGDSGPFAFFIEVEKTDGGKRVVVEVNYDEYNYINEHTGVEELLDTSAVEDSTIRDCIANEPAFAKVGTTYMLRISFNDRYHEEEDGSEELGTSFFSLKIPPITLYSPPVTPPLPPIYEQPKLSLSVIPTLGNVVKPLFLVHNTLQLYGEPVVGYLEPSNRRQTLTVFCSLYPDGPKCISDNAKSCLSGMSNVVIANDLGLDNFIRECVGIKEKLTLPRVAIGEIKNEAVRKIVVGLFKDDAVNKINEELETLSVKE